MKSTLTLRSTQRRSRSPPTTRPRRAGSQKKTKASEALDTSLWGGAKAGEKRKRAVFDPWNRDCLASSPVGHWVPLPPSLVGAGGEIVCLAFGTQPRDAGRLHAVQSLYPLHTVIAVNEKKRDPTDVAHFELREHDFSEMRGIRDSITAETSCVVLDWFWLAQNCYQKYYGPKWTTEKIPYMFLKCPRLTSVILPLESWFKTGGGLFEMLSKESTQPLRSAGIAWRPLTWDEARALNPIVAGTMLELSNGHLTEEILRSEAARVDAESPFIVFYKDPWFDAL